MKKTLRNVASHRFVIWLTFAGIAACILAWALPQQVLSEFRLTQAAAATSDTGAREEIARQLGVGADWTEIAAYIYCHIASPGRQRSEIEHDIARIGAYKVSENRNTNGVKYLFSRRELYINIYGVYVRYDSAGKAEYAHMLITTGPSFESVQEIMYDCPSSSDH